MCSVISQLLSLMMRHLVIGQRQKAPNFSAFHWLPHGCLITIGQHFVTTRVVHLPKRTKMSLITESDQSRANHQLLQLCRVRTAWSDLDQAVRAVHSCKSWFLKGFGPYSNTRGANRLDRDEKYHYESLQLYLCCVQKHSFPFWLLKG